MNSVSIGNVEITPLQDTGALMNLDYFFPKQATAFAAEFKNLQDERGFLQMSITCYLVRSAGQTIIVDTGVGPRRRSGLPRGHLDDALQQLGVAPSQIDVVLNTHLHVDHVGWNTVDREDGTREIFFPNAHFVFHQKEWDYWMTPEHLAAPGNEHLAECVEPLRNSGRISFFEGEAAFDENITFISTPGHTPGHVAIGIMSAGERAVIIGDASHHPAQLLHPDWSPQPDYDPVQSAQTRDALFDRAIAEHRTWIAGHWQYPGIGRIVRLGGKRTFQAL
ncbi:MAG: MBL fold metallo-hydrolase [Tepidiformaceae bacterium]